ncbi:hypothetical protein D9757_003206 [Collybiopsis confluens]|uniref:Uncharacterized protein n=1 Tax=Collybiopsis confluens TaxID=2823264 RepID=A0A8H5HYV3_9AGAR|nr:hypothetical protein D9757_003206 [Collybiopsis confluens]
MIRGFFSGWLLFSPPSTQYPVLVMTSPILIFDTLQFIALVALLIPFTTAVLSNYVGRMKTWYNLLCVCIVYCISFLLLVGHQSTKEEPPLGLCLFQAGAIYAAPPAFSGDNNPSIGGLEWEPLDLCSILRRLYWRLSSALLARRTRERSVTRLLVLTPFSQLLVLTPIVHVIIFWEAIFYGLSDVSTIRRDPSGIYCHVQSKIPTLITGASVIGFVVLSLLVQVGRVRGLRTEELIWLRLSAKYYDPVKRHARKHSRDILRAYIVKWKKDSLDLDGDFFKSRRISTDAIRVEARKN